MIPNWLYTGRLREHLAPRTYIAGGWAACPALAGDMDLWVIDVPYDSFDFAAALILGDLRDRGIEVAPEGAETVEEYHGIYIHIRKVAKMRIGGDDFHLMITDAPDIQSVLNNFDITTHQVAIGPCGEVIRGQDFTEVWEHPRVIPNRRNEKTDARLERICERFYHPRPRSVDIG